MTPVTLFVLRFLLSAVVLLCVPRGLRAADGILPHWIWASVEREPGQHVLLQKEFKTARAVVSATLNVAADFTRCRLRLNGETLVDLDEYGPWLTLDVTERIRIADNQFSLKCVAGEGPAAVALTLDISFADGSAQRLISDHHWETTSTDQETHAAVSLGVVEPELWNVGGGARITAFDDYEQWRQASGAEQGADPATFAVQPGFEIDLVRSAQPDEGSWVSMAFDTKGRLTIAREDRGLLRVSLSGDGGHVEQVETIEDSLLECRGLLYAHGALYANANNSKGMYRLRDTTGDDQFDEVKLLREFPGSVGHGRNDLALGPDGMIYAIHGDAVQIPTANVIDRTSPFRSARRGEPSREGYLVRTNADGTHWEVVAGGLRNPFGIDFNQDAEIFTYDADNEYDMGAPWYRPTRVCQLVSGADFGWRRVPNGQWPAYFPDHPDNGLPVGDVGKGSPTAVKSGRRSSFPSIYQRALFMLDWAYGRILACHLCPRGAGYACRIEQFVKGRPFNVTDLDFGPDGSMYVVTGGRKTQSALYRIRYTGPIEHFDRIRTVQQKRRHSFSSESRELRRSLANHHVDTDAEALDRMWSHLRSADPVLRNAARVAIEHLPVSGWQSAALKERDSEIAATALLALARAGDDVPVAELIERLNRFEVSSLSALGQLSVVHAYRLTLIEGGRVAPGDIADSKSRLLDWMLNASDSARAPIGSGDTVRSELAQLVGDLQLDGSLPLLIDMLKRANSQKQQMRALYILCEQSAGWTLDIRRLFFEALGELERTAFSGAGMPVRLQQIRERAIATLSDEERSSLKDLLKPASVPSAADLTVNRSHVQTWTLPELTARLDELSERGDSSRGGRLFREVRCAACHRINGRGGVLGPDLTSVSGRFSRRDLLSSILTPSEVVAEKYRSTRIVTSDGKVIIGQVLLGGDYRSSNLRIVENPLRPAVITEIAKQDVEVHSPSTISPMPKGLLDTLTAEEVRDLLGWLKSPE